jgi:hypothetical protein
MWNAMSKYVFTDDMGQISGFKGIIEGGDRYEEACQKMIIAGLEWLDEHPDADPIFYTAKNVYGSLVGHDPAAQDMMRVMGNAASDEGGGGATVAMMQACVQVCMWCRENSWEEYCKIMREGDPEPGKEDP